MGTVHQILKCHSGVKGQNGHNETQAVALNQVKWHDGLLKSRKSADKVEFQFKRLVRRAERGGGAETERRDVRRK